MSDPARPFDSAVEGTALLSPALGLVPPQLTPSVITPEQLPLIRMLQIVRDTVDSIHAGQRSIAEVLRNIKTSLPMQRKPLSRRTQSIHIQATLTRRNGLCPCCQEVPVCNEQGRLPGAEYDHFFARDKNRVAQTARLRGLQSEAHRYGLSSGGAAVAASGQAQFPLSDARAE